MSNASASTSDESPLRFHVNRHQNIRVTSDGTIARRVNTSFFARGLILGTRPVKVNERVVFKLMEMTENLGGFVYVGFTPRDPEHMVGITCQKLAQDVGYRSWFFPKDLCSHGRSLFYYITSDGVVHYGVDGTDKGVFQGVVKISSPLWPIFDIFGNSSAIRLVETYIPGVEPKSSTNKKLVPMKLHSIYSRNVRVSKNVVQRLDTRYTQGYIFSETPIKPEETLTIQIAPGQQGRYTGFIHLGVTCCDPAHLSRDELPDNVNHLVDRPEYWVLICDLPKLNCGEEITVTLTTEGQITYHGGKIKGVVHVDATLKLWFFVNVYGSTQAIHLLTCPEQTKVEEKECVVCYDNVIETALYKCGHTCMCFECAVEQWQGKGDGHCPLCRAVIRDVVRINK